MGENVEVDIIANDKGTPAWKRQADAVHAYLRELAKLDDIQKRNAAAARSQDKALSGIGNRVTQMAAGYLSLTSAVQMYVRAQQEAIDKGEKGADKQDELARRFRVQAGLKALEADAAQKQINQTAKDTATATESAFAAATALTSTGFDAKEASGAGLKVMLQSLQAQQLAGKNVDAGGLSESASQYLASQDMAKTGENLKKLVVGVQGLKETPLKMTDLGALAKEGAGLKSKMDWQTQMATFGMLRESLEPEVAATGMRKVLQYLTTMSEQKDRTEALKELRLKPAQVDLVGESPREALELIASRLEKLPKERQEAIKVTLFEGANVSAFNEMSKKQDRVAEFVKKLDDEKGFMEDYAVGASGRNAAGRRLDAETETLDAQTTLQYENTKKALDVVLRQQGSSIVDRFAKARQYEMLTYLGATPEQAVQGISASETVAQMMTPMLMNPTGVPTIGDLPTRVQKKVSEANDSVGSRQTEIDRLDREGGRLERESRQAGRDGDKALAAELHRQSELIWQQLQELKKLTAETQKPQKFTPRTDPKPAAPRPSAAIGGQ